jgi:hypothetical protein
MEPLRALTEAVSKMHGGATSLYNRQIVRRTVALRPNHQIKKPNGPDDADPQAMVYRNGEAVLTADGDITTDYEVRILGGQHPEPRPIDGESKELIGFTPRTIATVRRELLSKALSAPGQSMRRCKPANTDALLLHELDFALKLHSVQTSSRDRGHA